jgi:hypothetical protein
MKKVFFIATSLFFSLSVLSQEKLNTDDLIGYWQPSEESTQLFFWKDVNGFLQVQEISGTSGRPIHINSLSVRRDSVIVEETFLYNNWKTKNVYTLVDNKTLSCVVTGDSNCTLIYNKIK